MRLCVSVNILNIISIYVLTNNEISFDDTRNEDSDTNKRGHDNTLKVAIYRLG